MILSARSKSTDLACRNCGLEMVPRPAAPYPVFLQISFALSFVAFLIITRGPVSKVTLVGWCALQTALGILLIRRRFTARKRVYRCVRCSPTVG